ncbi:unnamed protein product [Durusdinium trenchii]|uniref:Secreted protein n=2 Tax=Durusdinium trenchii TaxID=1381693 RepID=A0ABP0REC3_9DINO
MRPCVTAPSARWPFAWWMAVQNMRCSSRGRQHPASTAWIGPSWTSEISLSLRWENRNSTCRTRVRSQPASTSTCRASLGRSWWMWCPPRAP